MLKGGELPLSQKVTERLDRRMGSAGARHTFLHHFSLSLEPPPLKGPVEVFLFLLFQSFALPSLNAEGAEVWDSGQRDKNRWQELSPSFRCFRSPLQHTGT